uniref:G_PROTEIN_RECEP_F1_2 domain-containing protein n=1 Tax=Meloidogyne hapla TaxID=6305 RepID=A0A1I8BW68_MELHA
MENISIFINKSKEIEDEVGDKMTIFEQYFYLINGLIGSLLNLIVLLIAYLNVDINDKPRQHPCEKVILSGHIYLLICLFYIISMSASLTLSAIIFYIAQKSRHLNSSKESKVPI